MRLAACVSVFLVPLASLAQSLTLTINNSTTTPSASAGPGDCDETAAAYELEYTTAVPSGDSYCQDLLVWMSLGTCGNAADAGDFQVGDVPAATLDTAPQGDLDFSVDSTVGLFRGAEDGGALCAPSAQADLTFNVCASFTYASDCESGTASAITDEGAQPTFEFDSSPPAIPSFSLTAGDTTITVTAQGDDSTTSMDIQYALTPTDGGVDDWFPELPNAISGSEGNYTLTGLNDGQSYDVQVQAENGSGLPSGWSAIQSATPILTYGFFQTYLADGGQERGGCSGAIGLAPWLAIAAARLITSRRRR
jgi:hypothetical protein